MQGDSLKGACTANCSKFDFEKFENSLIPLKGACAPMRGNRVRKFSSKNDKIGFEKYLKTIIRSIKTSHPFKVRTQFWTSLISDKNLYKIKNVRNFC